MFNLTDALLARGYKEEDIAKVWGGNWVRVMKAVVADRPETIHETVK